MFDQVLYNRTIAWNMDYVVWLCVSYDYWILCFPEFLDNQHMKVVRLSALRTGYLYPQETSKYQGHSVAGRNK